MGFGDAAHIDFRVKMTDKTVLKRVAAYLQTLFHHLGYIQTKFQGDL